MADVVSRPDVPETPNDNSIKLHIIHHGKPLENSFPQDATITELSLHILNELKIPPANQKFIVPKLGFLKPPFKDPSLPLS